MRSARLHHAHHRLQTTRGVVLKRAYVTYRGVTAGITLTNFGDPPPASQPPTIDPQGPCGIVCTSTEHVMSYNSKSYNGFAFGAGIEMPTFYNSDGIYRGHDYRHDFGGTTVTADASQKAPDIPAYIEYAPSKQNRVRASAVVRNFFYRDLVADKSRHALGWGAQFSGNFSFWKPLTFNFQAVYGKGLGCYIQDLEGRALSFTPKSDKPGEMQANPMMSVTFGASYNITPKLQVNAVGFLRTCMGCGRLCHSQRQQWRRIARQLPLRHIRHSQLFLQHHSLPAVGIRVQLRPS